AHCKTEPVFAGLLFIGSEDFYLVSGFQLVSDRYQPAVDLGTYTLGAHFRVYFKGKIERSRPSGKFFEFSLGGKNENLVAEQVLPKIIYKLYGRDVILLKHF